jgi:hypothetical protein
MNMNQTKNLLLVITLAAVAGCATSQSTIVVKDPVGPDLVPPRKLAAPAGQGELVVYSALEVVNPVSSDFPTHAAYTIYGADGKLFQRVDNRSGSFYQSPAIVVLPQGEYTVKAPVANYGVVTVPVVIKENETTTLDFNGGHFRQKKPTGAGQWVRLPSGEVIGMRAP